MSCGAGLLPLSLSSTSGNSGENGKLVPFTFHLRNIYANIQCPPSLLLPGEATKPDAARALPRSATCRPGRPEVEVSERKSGARTVSSVKRHQGGSHIPRSSLPTLGGSQVVPRLFSPRFSLCCFLSRDNSSHRR